MTATEWTFYKEQVERGDRLEKALRDVLTVFPPKGVVPVESIVTEERLEAWAAALEPQVPRLVP